MRKNGLKQRNFLTRAAALWLAGVMAVSLIGCGKSGSGEDGAAGSGDASGKNVAMGRYVETLAGVDVRDIMDLKELADGRLVLLENGVEGRWISEDAGITWQPDELPEWNSRAMEYLIHDMKAAPDGSVAILCMRSERLMDMVGEIKRGDAIDAEGGSVSGDGDAAEDGSESGGGDVAESESEDRDEDAAENEALFRIRHISAKGESTWIELPIEYEEFANCLCFSEDGSRLFVATHEQNIYEIDWETGNVKLFLEADIAPGMFCVWDNYMAVKNEREGIVLYQLDTMERIEDDVITDFVKENCVINGEIAESTYSVFPAEEEGIYLVCRKGVYRHVIGGTVMEQVINGGLCSLSDPMKHVVKMIRTEKEGFLAAFVEGALSSFVYDPNISTVPAQRLVAYSLTENDILRQAILRYQAAHPDVYAEYRVGMDEESGITGEDAVKKLNTEIMAGKGPDLLILDGLPVNSYVEKGVLTDLTPYLAELEKEEKILPNVKEAFTSEGKMFMIPAAMTISMYMTDKENMTDVSDLSSLADMIVRLREEHPGEGILQTYSEDMILNAMMPVSAPLWLKETGELNAEELSDYLEQTKRIYDACMEGLPEDLILHYQDLAENGVNSSDAQSAYNDLQSGAAQIVAGEEKVTLGELRNAYNYAVLQSVRRSDNGQNGLNCQAALLPGRVNDGFRPYVLMGINAVSEKADLAGGLMREILSGEVQSLLYPSGFPVNEEGLQTYLKTVGGQIDRAKPGESFGMNIFTDTDGTMIAMSIYALTEQETEELCELLSTVRTPYLSDTVMEDAVREVGKWYLEGRCSLEEAVEEIQEKLAIYMAE